MIKLFDFGTSLSDSYSKRISAFVERFRSASIEAENAQTIVSKYSRQNCKPLHLGFHPIEIPSTILKSDKIIVILPSHYFKSSLALYYHELGHHSFSGGWFPFERVLSYALHTAVDTYYSPQGPSVHCNNYNSLQDYLYKNTALILKWMKRWLQRQLNRSSLRYFTQTMRYRRTILEHAKVVTALVSSLYESSHHRDDSSSKTESKRGLHVNFSSVLGVFIGGFVYGTGFG